MSASKAEEQQCNFFQSKQGIILLLTSVVANLGIDYKKNNKKLLFILVCNKKSKVHCSQIECRNWWYVLGLLLSLSDLLAFAD